MRFLLPGLLFLVLLSGCDAPETLEEAIDEPQAADLILTNARIYTFSWPDPDAEGKPSESAPVREGVWQPDAAALAIVGSTILALGGLAEVEVHRSEDTQVIDLQGATVLPGLIESHGHYNELGEQADRVDVSSATSVEEMAHLLTERTEAALPGEWIIGGGWDEGAWANNLPVKSPVDAVSPDHPVVLLGRRGFGLLANSRALEAAGISAETPSPSGGEVVKDANGEPTGVLLNRARALIMDVIPAASLAQKKRILQAGLTEMVEAGYVTAHHAGVYGDYMPAYEALAEEGALPVRVEAMIAARPENQVLMERWIARGPSPADDSRLWVRAVKAYYDGSLGSRGAKMIEDYSDQPGHRGVSGDEYGFPEDMVTRAIQKGFQVGVHAIGDAGNRAVLDYYERVLSDSGHAEVRHRIEHAQIVHPEDFARFGALNLVASMEPGHAVEDSPWAEARVGPERILGGYAWRSLRRAGAGLIFNSDLSGTDYDIFYGLHCAVTRTDRNGEPEGGWYPEQAVSMEEALRAYTVWPAEASGKADMTGTLSVGKWADITVISIDPLNVATPAGLFEGKALMTIIGGEIEYDGRDVKEFSEGGAE
ncbi:MAG: amidohydrolase [Gammaproteobacteria bacterium]|nr:MAG: amidohydrolase [Gammaproteobacteria bacterium]